MTTDLWTLGCERLAAELPAQQFNTWIRPLAPPQLAALAAGIPLSAAELQTTPILVNPPSLNFITALLLAELHGRMGYFPPVLRLRPIPGSLPPRYEVAEVLNLQGVRDQLAQPRALALALACGAAAAWLPYGYAVALVAGTLVWRLAFAR